MFAERKLYESWSRHLQYFGTVYLFTISCTRSIAARSIDTERLCLLFLHHPGRHDAASTLVGVFRHHNHRSCSSDPSTPFVLRQRRRRLHRTSLWNPDLSEIETYTLKHCRCLDPADSKECPADPIHEVNRVAQSVMVSPMLSTHFHKAFRARHRMSLVKAGTRKWVFRFVGVFVKYCCGIAHNAY